MNIEVLAPVGNTESLKAAVYSGADAVYFGGSHFNARRNAENFEDFNLKSAISFCHLNGVKAYLTLNILIKDSEINNALDLAKETYLAGIDGVIVQDLGLAKLLKENLPKLTLHASTQLSTLSKDALYLLKELGFKRVVPARELSKEQLKEIVKTADSLDMEVEVFVHGALCMSVSGQCYFSAFLGGRSANRGLCAGTCRLPFSAEKGTGYDLSLKDLSLVNHIKELKNMGVTSLKIEGRMKRPEYVAKTVQCLKSAIEKDAAEKTDLEILEKVFSRDGFTNGYFTSQTGKSMFGRRTESDKLKTDEVLSSIHEIYRRPLQRLPIDFDITIQKGKSARLIATCKDKSVTVFGDVPEMAINRSLDREKILECLKKLGGTPYSPGKININLEDGLMLPLSRLNALRSQAVEELNKSRLEQELSFKDFEIPPLKAQTRKITGFFVRFEKINQAEFFVGETPKLKGVSFPAKELIENFSENNFPKENIYAELPRGNADDGYTETLLNKLTEIGIKKVICHSLAALYSAKNKGFEIIAGFGLNLLNSFSLKTLKDFKVNKFVISPEISFSELEEISQPENSEIMAICYGRQPLMLTKNCPAKNGAGCSKDKKNCKITDRLGIDFPLICGNGFTEILNSKPTNLSGFITKLSANTGFINFTLETPKEAINIYNRIFKNSPPTEGFTKGLYKNGVM